MEASIGIEPVHTDLKSASSPLKNCIITDIYPDKKLLRSQFGHKGDGKWEALESKTANTKRKYVAKV